LTGAAPAGEPVPNPIPLPNATSVPYAIEAVGVHRSYRMDGVTVQALRGVSLGIAEGEYVAVTGPSGSGKSTLMHLLGALDRPSAGQLLIGGRDTTRLDEAGLARVRGTEIGFVFQSFQLLARTSARDNVALPLVYRGVGRTERRRRAVAALEAVGLGHRLSHRPTQLSGGEQQRVAIARALVGEPRLVLADEPTGNLDSVSGGEVLAALERLNRERGVAVVLVTHDAEVAARAARLIRMRDGEIVADSARDGDGEGGDGGGGGGGEEGRVRAGEGPSGTDTTAAAPANVQNGDAP
jgi:putative ABC transport system ATP-binding protein